MSDFINDFWPTDWNDALILALLAICTIGAAALLLYGAFWCVDHLGAREYRTSAIVDAHHFTPQHTQLMLVGKIMVPQTVGPTYEIHLNSDEGTDWLGVDRYTYDTLHDGQPVTMTYDKGRLSGSLNARMVSW